MDVSPEGTEATWTAVRRVVRILVWAVAGLLALAVLSAGAAMWVLHHLDHPSIRGWITGSAHRALGIELTYEGVDLSLTRGLTLQGLRVLTPEPFRLHAPTLAEVDRVEVAWDLGSLASGPLRISRLVLSGVRLALVQDEAGNSSLQALRGTMPREETETPPDPLSHGMPIRGLGIEVDSLEVSDVVLSRHVLRGSEVVRSEVLEGVVLHGELHAGNAPENASVTIQAPAGGSTRFSIREAGPDGRPLERSALGRPVLRILVSDPLHAAVDLEVSDISQDFQPDLSPSGPVLAMGLAVALHPEESRISVRMDRMTVGDGIATGVLEADYFEEPGREVLARIGRLEVSADLGRLPEAMRVWFPEVQWNGGTLRLAGEGIDLLRTLPRVRVSGRAGAHLDLPQVTVVAGERRLEAREIEVHLDATGAPGGALRADASLGFEVLKVLEPGRLVTVHDGSAAFGATIEDISKAIAREPSGTATWKAGARLASWRGTTGHFRLQGLDMKASGPIRTEPPYQADGVLQVDGLAWTPARGAETSVPGGRFEWALKDVVPDDEAPMRSRGGLSLQGRLGDIAFDANVVKAVDHADFRASLVAATLQVLTPFADPARDLRIPLDHVGLTVQTNGRVSDLAAAGGPFLDQRVTASLTGLKAMMAGHRLEVPLLAMDGTARGRPRDLEARGTLQTTGARLDGRVSLRRVALATEARLRASTPRARLSLDVAGRRGPILDANLEAQVEGPEHAVTWSGRLSAHALSDLKPLLPPEQRSAVDLATLRADIETSGRFHGVLGPGLRPAPSPLESARGQASFRMHLAGLAYRSEHLEVEAPDLSAAIEVERPEARGTVRATLSYPSLIVDQRVRRFEVTQGSHALTIETDGNPREGELTVALEGSVASVSHDASATYPIGPSSLRVHARISRLDSVRLDEFVLENPQGGTRFTATAALDDLGGRLPATAATAWDLVVGRRSLAVTGTLEQRLDPLSRESFRVSGQLEVPFHIQSGDRALFRVSASVSARGVRAENPTGTVVVLGLNGTIPIEEEVVLTPDRRPSLLLETDRNLFSRVRFTDQHPFLRGGGFVVADRLVVGPLDVGPVAGNLRILRNLISLDQIEATWQEGKVSGQVIVEYHPGDPQVSFRGKVSGVRPSGSDERLDANAALDVALGRREVAGRIHFVRIGRGHLRDLMNALDPYYENVSMNRIRKFLAYGYPRYARVRVNGGFLSAKVELGGLGSLVRIDEVRGVPTAPLLNRLLGPPKD